MKFNNTLKDSSSWSNVIHSWDEMMIQHSQINKDEFHINIIKDNNDLIVSLGQKQMT